MNKKIAILLGVLFVLLLGFNAWRYLTADRTAPRITFSPDRLTWSEDDGEAALLADVTATDKVDGDVTASVRIKSVTPTDDGVTAIVVYYAKDSHHNIATANRIINYKAGKSAAEKESEEAAAEAERIAELESSIAESIRESEAESRKAAEEESRSMEEEAESENEEETLSPEEENESRIAELPDGAPHIYLSHYVVGVPLGGSLNLLSYVSNITDDQDSRDYLSGRIEIEGAEDINYNQEGEYEVRFYVRDSSGTRSNAAIMKVIVQ